MLIEKIISVVSSEVKPARTAGKTYLEVIDQDGVKYACWVEGLWNILGKNAGAKIGFEPKGIFKNIVEAETVAENLPPPQVSKETKTPPLGKAQTDGRNRAFSLSYAKDLNVADKIKGNQIIFTAEMFNQYLEGNITVPIEVLIKYVQEQVKAEFKKGTTTE